MCSTCNVENHVHFHVQVYVLLICTAHDTAHGMYHVQVHVLVICTAHKHAHGTAHGMCPCAVSMYSTWNLLNLCAAHVLFLCTVHKKWKKQHMASDRFPDEESMGASLTEDAAFREMKLNS